MNRAFQLLSLFCIIFIPVNGFTDTDTDAALSKAVILLHQNKTIH